MQTYETKHFSSASRKLWHLFNTFVDTILIRSYNRFDGGFSLSYNSIRVVGNLNFLDARQFVRNSYSIFYFG